MNQILKNHSQQVAVILAKYPPDQKRAAVMPLLHLVQEEAGFVSRTAMKEVAEITEVSVTDVASIVGFYTLFYEAPAGKIRIQVCTDVACELRGAKDYLADLCQQLGINPGETTPDGIVTIEEVKCLAACDKAPVFQTQIGDELEYHENQTSERTMDWLKSMVAAMSGFTSKIGETKRQPETKSPESNGGDDE